MRAYVNTGTINGNLVVRAFHSANDAGWDSIAIVGAGGDWDTFPATEDCDIRDCICDDCLVESDECERCESTGRITVIAQGWDDEPYETSASCPVCYPNA